MTLRGDGFMAKKIDPELNPGAELATAPELNPELIREAEASPQPQTPQEQSEWREEFPYPWDEDEVVTCRDTLRFLLGGSGALFLATGVLAIIGNLPASPAAQAVPIAKVSDLTVNGWKVFNFPDQYAEGILIRLSEQQFVAY